MNRAANTFPKALRQVDLGLATCEESELYVIDEQKELGESLRDLRIAGMVPRNAIAQKLGVDSMLVSALERRCSSDNAKKYRAAVIALSENEFAR